jgi:hypothetical protein
VSQYSDENPLGNSAEPRQEVDPVLRAKYLDYCSARISEVFLSLSDEHAYELMEEAALEADVSVGSLSFQTMMRLVTQKLQRSVPLPDLESWIVEYEREPERYDPYLLGLWQTQEAVPEKQGEDQ